MKRKTKKFLRSIWKSCRYLLTRLEKTTIRHKRVIIAFLILWALWFFGLGALGGWLLSKGTIRQLPKITAGDKVLVVAPHVDDEIIGAGGVLQEAKKNGAKVLVVYMTSGDDNAASVIGEGKSMKLPPNDFLKLGETRAKEGERALKVLGLGEEEYLFLGYPDGGLNLMLSRYFNTTTPYSSRGTKLTYNPYDFTYRKKQSYTGANVLTDVTKIVKDFDPTIIFVSHLRDKHSDHSATFKYVHQALEDSGKNPLLYGYLVHYTLYPPEKELAIGDYLYPPKKLFSHDGWYSFNLSSEQEQMKLVAVNENETQRKWIVLSNFLQSFVKRNEIFELIE